MMGEWILVIVLASYRGGPAITVERFPTETACSLVGNAFARNAGVVSSAYSWKWSCTNTAAQP
jgi:hypothetical protein